MRSYLLTQRISLLSVKEIAQGECTEWTEVESQQRCSCEGGEREVKRTRRLGGECKSQVTQKGQTGFQRRLPHFTVRNLQELS